MMGKQYWRFLCMWGLGILFGGLAVNLTFPHVLIFVIAGGLISGVLVSRWLKE